MIFLRGSVVVAIVASSLAAACEPAPFRPPDGFRSPGAAPVLSLGLGQSVTYDVQQVGGTIEIPPVAESRSYTFVVHDARDTPGLALDAMLTVTRVPTSLDLGVAPDRGSRRASSSARSASGPEDPFARWYGGGETRFREGTRRELGLSGARSATPASRDPVRAYVSANVPAVGALMEFASPVEADGTFATCESTTRVTGRVVTVGERFAIVEDTLVAGHLDAFDYATILEEIESVAFPVDSAYFGVPADIDGNGRVLAFITGEVNRSGAAGFFTASDLADAADCPTSNEGELLWLIAPDPARRAGIDPIPTDLVRRRVAGVVVHELQHLIHQQRRVLEAGGDLASADDPWLNEGLSHIAEEVAGLYAAGLRTGANLAFEDLGAPGTSDRFDRYHLNDMRFMRDYFRATGEVPAFSSDPVTRGELRRARGFGYLFLRWLADQHAVAEPDGLVGSVLEEVLFRDLTVGSGALLTSVDNVLGALAGIGHVTTWEELFASYVGMPAVDDVAAPAVQLAPRLRLRTWNLPLAYENARDAGYSLDFPDGFPLIPTLVVLPNVPATGFRSEFDLFPSTGVYYRVEAGFDTPLSRVTVTSGDGTPLPSGSPIRITVIRTL